jgi:hypothetical protein
VPENNWCQEQLVPGLQYCNLNIEKVSVIRLDKNKKAAPISTNLTRTALYLHNSVNLSANTTSICPPKKTITTASPKKPTLLPVLCLFGDAVSSSGGLLVMAYIQLSPTFCNFCRCLEQFRGNPFVNIFFTAIVADPGGYILNNKGEGIPLNG